MQTGLQTTLARKLKDATDLADDCESNDQLPFMNIQSVSSVLVALSISFISFYAIYLALASRP